MLLRPLKRRCSSISPETAEAPGFFRKTIKAGHSHQRPENRPPHAQSFRSKSPGASLPRASTAKKPLHFHLSKETRPSASASSISPPSSANNASPHHPLSFRPTNGSGGT